MTITVNTASTASRLTTVQRLAEQLGNTNLEDDKLLEKLIDSASALIVSYTGRTFAREVVTETLGAHGQGQTRLVLSRTPINSITSITKNGSSIQSTSYEIEDAEAGFVWREHGWRDTTLYRQWITPIDSRFQRKDYAVTYDAGYYLPGSTARNLPEEIEFACLEIAKSWFLDKDSNRNIKRERIGDAWIERYDADQIGAIPQAVASVLDQYRRIDLTF